MLFLSSIQFFFFNGITFPKFLRLSVGIFAVASDISSFFFFSSFPFFILRDLNERGFYGFVDIQHAIYKTKTIHAYHFYDLREISKLRE